MYAIDSLENCFGQFSILTMRKLCVYIFKLNIIQFPIDIVQCVRLFLIIRLKALILRFVLLFIHSLDLAVFNGHRYEKVQYDLVRQFNKI